MWNARPARRCNSTPPPGHLLHTQAPEAGGLACTDVTPEGFLFDMGGHVIFSHWDYFDQLLDTALGAGPEAWNTLQRVSYVWIKNRWVAYPFQNNISALPKEDQVRCLGHAQWRVCARVLAYNGRLHIKRKVVRPPPPTPAACCSAAPHRRSSA